MAGAIDIQHGTAAPSMIRSCCPVGASLATLKDAGTYITKLSKAEHEALEWQTAMEALILALLASDFRVLVSLKITSLRPLFLDGLASRSPHRAHPEQGFRACLGIIRLARSYGHTRGRDAL